MRKKLQLIKSLLVAACLMVGGSSAWGAGEWSVNFVDVYNDAGFTGDQGQTISETVATIGGTTMGTVSFGGVAINSNFVLQTGTNWLLRTGGLYQFNSGGRSMGMLSCTKDQIITIVGTGNPNPTTNATLKSQDGNTYVYTVNADGDVKFTPARYLYFTSISVANPSASAVSYTVKYVDEKGTEIKTATTGEGDPGAGITITSSEKESFFNDGATKKYIYKSDDSEGKTIASDGSTVVTIIFREAVSYTYSVADNLGNTLVSGSSFEGEDVIYYVSYYAFKDGKFYKNPSLSEGTLNYGQAKISAISGNTEVTVTYSEEENTDVVFFSEAENLTSITPYEDGFTNIRMSNGKAGYYDAETAFTTLPAGIYTLTAATRSGTTTFYAGTVGSGQEILKLTSSGAVTINTSASFVLTGSTDIYTSVGSSSAYFDYVIIRKITSIPATITTSGFSTIASDCALDLAKLPAGVKAYKVSEISSTAVTLEEVTEAVAAGTGLILEGAAGSYNIPVAASGTDISATNKLKAAVTATEVAANAAYVLKDGKFCLVTAASSVPAGKAYLLASDVPATARELNIEEGTTGINSVQDSRFMVNDYYDLQGRRVAQPTKGLYIQNGRKVLVK